jgi:hypothetical protein
MMASAYLYSFDQARLLDNLLNYATVGLASSRFTNTCSFFVPTGAQVVVVVNVLGRRVISGLVSSGGEPKNSGGTAQTAGGYEYLLEVVGLPCPTPRLRIAPTSKPREISVAWPTWAGENMLESSPSLTSPAWTPVTTQPIVCDGCFRLTNSAPGPSRFYRFTK